MIDARCIFIYIYIYVYIWLVLIKKCLFISFCEPVVTCWALEIAMTLFKSSLSPWADALESHFTATS